MNIRTQLRKLIGTSFLTFQKKLNYDKLNIDFSSKLHFSLILILLDAKKFNSYKMTKMKLILVL